ncbi:MAG: DUF983 domain-containing protein, partial [Hyphomicrobiales bacterium]|nr:DUF983 domain-containing protein [Hyphomicrobiales bacterium]
FSLPLWGHAIIWTPIIIVACIWSLRLAKAVMIALQYQSGARQDIEIEKD